MLSLKQRINLSSMCFIWIGSISGIVSLYYSYNSRFLALETVGNTQNNLKSEMTRDELKAFDLISMTSHTFFVFSILTLIVGVLGIFFKRRMYKTAVYIKVLSTITLFAAD